MPLQKLLVEEGVKRGLKQSRDYSVSVLGYDFIGLVGRLMVFFLASFMILIIKNLQAILISKLKN